MSDTAGMLSASTNAAGGGGTVGGSGSAQLTISGTLAQVNTVLASLLRSAFGIRQADLEPVARVGIEGRVRELS